jgi:hypothetical protein
VYRNDRGGLDDDEGHRAERIKKCLWNNWACTATSHTLLKERHAFTLVLISA